MMLDARAILFDMDGLMVDSEPLWYEVERDFARARGGDFTPAIAHTCVGRGLPNTLRVMRDEMGLDVDEVRDVGLILDAFLARAPSLVLKPGCKELLDASEGVVPIAVASSSARRLVLGVLEGLGVAKRFGAIVTGDDVAHPKPAPDLFVEAARRLGVGADGCVVLEDSLAGATAGRAAKMRVIAVPERETPGLEAVATLVARDLYEARAQMRLVRS
jgi:beta-phosphoglucomutase-like phosphatase (HAD superfamily)